MVNPRMNILAGEVAMESITICGNDFGVRLLTAGSKEICITLLSGEKIRSKSDINVTMFDIFCVFNAKICDIYLKKI